jgi:hypothetical protein
VAEPDGGVNGEHVKHGGQGAAKGTGTCFLLNRRWGDLLVVLVDILLAFSYPLYHFIHLQGVDLFVFP